MGNYGPGLSEALHIAVMDDVLPKDYDSLQIEKWKTTIYARDEANPQIQLFSGTRKKDDLICSMKGYVTNGQKAYRWNT